MLINNINVNDRHNYPPVLSRVGLRVFFIQDGEYYDPYEISAVTIFRAEDNYNPSSLLGEEELISSGVSSLIKMNFANSASLTSDSSFDSSNYSPGPMASGIFRLRRGEYVVVLDGNVNLSGNNNLWGNTDVIANSCSTVGDYLDVWTIRATAGTDLECVFNEFRLRHGNLLSITQPLLLRTRNNLFSNNVVLGSKVNIKVGTQINIENRDIDEGIKNLFRDSVVTSASLEIVKENSEQNLPARVTVSSFADTSSLVEITSDNTLVYNWNTQDLTTHAQALAGNLGSLKGMYYIRVKYTLLDETIISQPMYLTVA